MNKILFVDDEPSILKVLECFARSHGYAPRCATSGEEALQMVIRDQIRVIFTDLRMPAMDGLELCRKIKELDPGACVYAVSGYVSAYTPDQFRDAGFDGYFPKPFKMDLLLEACRIAFDKVAVPEEQKPDGSS